MIKGLNVKADTGTAATAATAAATRARNSRACVREGLYRLQLVPDENYAILRAANLSAEESHKFLIMVPSFIILTAPLVKLRYQVIQLLALAIS